MSNFRVYNIFVLNSKNIFLSQIPCVEVQLPIIWKQTV